MSELSRLDTLAADRAKADFISSISHELRSPLHGVLASAELLKAMTKDTTSLDIINTIETCGSTLLDTMENLLTFAKSNEIALNRQKGYSSKHHSMEQSPGQSLTSLNTDVDLGLVVEEVMNANISGHQFRSSLEVHSSHNIRPDAAFASSNQIEDSVTVICDIDCQRDWTFATQACSWKRIVMNLLGNSLKYTDAGYIHVRLSQEEMADTPNGSHRTLVTLSVEDTGKGISEKYMKHHLFTPFHQEEPLCPGTGLGLSIVHQLVASLGGHIDIQSEVQQGTTVKVTATVESLAEISNTDLTQDVHREALLQLKSRKVGLVGFDIYPDIRETSTGILSTQAKKSLAIKSSLTRAIEKGFGLKAVTATALNSADADIDILMTTESHFRDANPAAGPPRERPLIVLCSNLTLDYRSVSHANGPVIYLSQPYVHSLCFPSRIYICNQPVP
jgi:signal transduction histidine kinase